MKGSSTPGCLSNYFNIEPNIEYCVTATGKASKSNAYLYVGKSGADLLWRGMPLPVG